MGRADVLQTVFEPIVELGSGQIAAFEGLTRFATRTPRPPEEWFARAAAQGLAVALEIRAVASALPALSVIPEPLLLAVNVSPATACSASLMELLAGADTSRVIVEVAEYAPVQDHDSLRHALDHLRSVGIRIALEGVGWQIDRMAHVARLRPDVIKLDPFVVAQAAAGGPLAAHARGVVAYANAVEVPVVAEGIRTQDSLDAITGLGVELGQGERLARPEPLDVWCRHFGWRAAAA